MIEVQWQGAQVIAAAMPRAPGQRSVPDDEQAGFLLRGADQIYCVHHRPRAARIGRVLLAGPFASSREHRYVPWVRWARFLAAHGLEVLRFDYRGTGESSGDFAQMDLDAWFDDVRCCARWLERQGGGCPLVLHGLELGALLASRAFEQGMGSALLLWSAPSSGREILRRALQIQRFQQYAMGRQLARGSGGGCTAELEAGRSATVNGSSWSPRLWSRSSEYVLPDLATSPGGGAALPYGGRPYRAVELDESAGPLYLPAVSGRPSGHGGQLNPDLTPLFQASCDWICSCIERNRGKHEAHPAD